MSVSLRQMSLFFPNRPANTFLAESVCLFKPAARLTGVHKQTVSSLTFAQVVASQTSY